MFIPSFGIPRRVHFRITGNTYVFMGREYAITPTFHKRATFFKQSTARLRVQQVLNTAYI